MTGEPTEIERALVTQVGLLRDDLEREWEQVQSHCTKALQTDPDEGEAEAALVALSLDHAYQAFETLLLRLERALALPERQGALWHAALLEAARSPLPGLRPAILAVEAHED